MVDNIETPKNFGTSNKLDSSILFSDIVDKTFWYTQKNINMVDTHCIFISK